MNCLEADALLQRHFDAEIPPRQGFALSRHLQRCSSCRLEFDKIRREMRDLIVDVAEPRFDADRLRSQIAEAISEIRPRHPIPAAPISITLCFLFAGMLGWNFFQPPNPERPPATAPSNESSRMILPGAEVSLESDAELCEGQPALLHAGAATVQVLPDTGAFLLETPAGTVLCREGKFRVGVHKEGKSASLLVLEGEVGVSDASGTRKLKAGEAAYLKSESQ